MGNATSPAGQSAGQAAPAMSYNQLPRIEAVRGMPVGLVAPLMGDARTAAMAGYGPGASTEPFNAPPTLRPTQFVVGGGTGLAVENTEVGYSPVAVLRSRQVDQGPEDALVRKHLYRAKELS